MRTFQVQQGNYKYNRQDFQTQKFNSSNNSSSTVQVGNFPLENNSPDSLLISVSELIAAYLSGKSQKTISAYHHDLLRFTGFLGASDISEAISILIASGHGGANLCAIRYKDKLIQQSMAPATINRNLSALRSLIQLAQTLGMVTWELQVPSVKAKALRDTRGVGLEGVKRLLGLAQMQPSPVKAARDTAILRLLFDLALRRSEVASLDYEDVDISGSRIMVIGKGCSEKEPMTLPSPTRFALQEWIACRGSNPGALFYNRDRARKGKGSRLSDNGIYRMVCKLGKRALLKAKPHGIRHTAITTVLDITGGDLRMAQRFGRHANPNTTILYDDHRKDAAGEAAKKLAETINC